MITDWRLAEAALRSAKIKSSGKNELVSIASCPESLSCIGIGTDAAVFRFDDAPAYAFKIYTEESLGKKALEEAVYLQIGDSPYFPRYYGSGENYIVLSYEQGVTLYDCLLLGISVPDQVIIDVENARNYIRSKGLNPRDIHLKNVLLHEGRGKVIDVSEYVKEGNDYRWEHLLRAYNIIYPLIAGKRIPLWMLEAAKRGYYRISKALLWWKSRRG
ncbi:serine/threonine protein kinase [Paenibacillus abyssi]|uniref:Serine/threonine protein kinase n=1 Tax=Paenibacillus abyssi TaxID=1340531 RepID=A0A917G7S7_9BACL|nr:serine/threonine protein kinase [Paenibacillus abyssi]GGG26091.1 hypothetical protein GCM10010916_48100 [Paenibacillus abyssi]